MHLGKHNFWGPCSRPQKPGFGAPGAVQSPRKPFWEALRGPKTWLWASWGRAKPQEPSFGGFAAGPPKPGFGPHEVSFGGLARPPQFGFEPPGAEATRRPGAFSDGLAPKPGFGQRFSQWHLHGRAVFAGSNLFLVGIATQCNSFYSGTSTRELFLWVQT